MDNMELFEKHLKGNLNDSEATEFYSRLAIDENMRHEFNSFVSVKEGIRQSLSSFEPTAALKSSVFASAGLSDSAVVSSPKSSNSGFWSSRVFTGALSALSGIIITLLLLKMFDVSFDNNEQAELFSVNNFHPEFYPEYSVEMPKESNASINKPEIVYIDRYLPVELNEDESKIMKTVSKSNKSSESFGIDYRNDFSEISSDYEDYKPLNISGVKNRFNAEVMGITGANLPPANIFPERYSNLNNLNINLLYKIKRNIGIGLGFSQETFHTIYEGTEADGSIYKYYQQPNLSTISVLARYNPFEYKNISPYVQAGIGFNQAGYIIAPTIGAELRLYPSISFILGMDYKLLGFKHQNTWFDAKKLTVRYGFSFNF